MPRIALVFEFGTLHGGERSMLAAVERLSGEFEFSALAPADGRLAAALARHGIEHVPFECRDPAGAARPRAEVCGRLLEGVGRCAPDVLHANSLAMGRLTGAVAGQLDVPAVAHLRDILRLSRAAVADLNRNRLLLAVSQATRDFHAQQGADGDRLRVVYNGIDSRHFQPRPATGGLRRELGLSDESFLVLTVGQIGLRKGQDVLAEAAALAADRLPDVHYLLVGERHSRKPESVEFEEDVVRRFEAGSLAGRLHRLGHRDDVPRLMNEADLLVHPAHQEPLGRVLLEAAASGLPILATAVGGTQEIVTDGVSARLVPPADPAALAQGLVELWSDRQFRRRLAAAARRRVEADFSLEHSAAELAGIWNDLA